MPTLQERIRGGLYGLLVGDALGVPYEFHDAAEIPPLAEIEMQPPPGFQRAHAGVPAGTWSDDGAQALCLLASLLHQGRLDADDLARRLLNWANVGYMAVDYQVFDIGMQTQKALSRLARGMSPLLAGPAGERDNGNGSLMRVLPLALWHRGSDSDLVADACAQSRITHGHERAQAVCAFYCLWARELFTGGADAEDGAQDNRRDGGKSDGENVAWDRAAARLRACLPAHPHLAAEVRNILDPVHARQIGGSGYVLDTLWSTRQALAAAPDYAGVVRAAIALGNDTDTTACVAGGLAGLRGGIEDIPSHWRLQLRGQDLLQPLLTELLGTL